MPMKVTDGAPPTQQWVPQSEPLDLNDAIGYVEPDDPYNTHHVDIHLEDLDPKVQHRIKTQPEAVALLRSVCACNASDAQRIDAWLAENAPEESP